jgi:hypothetical protein
MGSNSDFRWCRQAMLEDIAVLTNGCAITKDLG